MKVKPRLATKTKRAPASKAASTRRARPVARRKVVRARRAAVKPGKPVAKTKVVRRRSRPVGQKVAAEVQPLEAATPVAPRKALTRRRPVAAKVGEAVALRPVARRKVAPRRTERAAKPIQLPPLLLEGDHPAEPVVSGPGEKFILGPVPPTDTSEAIPVVLPESYGTKKLFLTARDPHWLYAHWDFTREQQSRFNRQSVDGHLVLRVSYAPPDEKLAVEMHVHPESHHWFAHVERPATSYTAELGYYNQRRKWVSLASAAPAGTPPETLGEDGPLRFATLPVEVPFAALLNLSHEAHLEAEPLTRALEVLRERAHPSLPVQLSPAPARRPWTPERTRAVAVLSAPEPCPQPTASPFGGDEFSRGGPEELKALGEEEKLETPGFELGGSEAGFSPGNAAAGGEAAGKKFWFTLNAELVIYGATERDATVQLGGRTLKLRDDGSFRCRFALPDGCFDLPVHAVSADGTEVRAAELGFVRTTESLGEVGVHAQEAGLNPPLPENV